jgi:hypothetical protein
MEKMTYNEKGLLIVKENHCCEHFEPDDGALVPMRECWCCKWSNFRLENKSGVSETISVCNYAGNAKIAINR